MASEVKLPRLGQGMEAGTIVKWLKSEGEPVEKGEPLYELDTDKVTQEVESDFAGTLLKIAIAEGEVAVGKTIGVIGEEGEEFSIAEPEAAEKVTEKKEEPKAAPEPEPEAPKPSAARDGRVKASPLARRIARERGIDLAAVRGTGPEGRIVAEDVERAEAAPATAPAAVSPGEAERRELTSTRRTIAKRLTEAWTVPVFQLQASADMTQVNALVARLAGGGTERHGDRRPREGQRGRPHAAPRGQRRMDGRGDPPPSERERRHRRRGSAGAGRAGDPGRRTAAARRDLRCAGRAGRARARGEAHTRGSRGRDVHDLEPGDVRRRGFTAVLNPPQAAIVAVGATEDRVVAVDGQPAVRPTMTLVATFDHRAVDGAPAAGFLQTLKSSWRNRALAL